MQNAISRRTRLALLCACLIAIVPHPALAQSGSAGGSIGNDEKSLSGSRETSRSAEPERPARRSKPEAEEPRRSASRRSGGGGGGGGGNGNFDGVWTFASKSTSCPDVSGTIDGTIVGNRFVIAGGGGTVSPNGTIVSSGVDAQGRRTTASGRFSGNTGSGTYRRSDGCGGSWFASKQ